MSWLRKKASELFDRVLSDPVGSDADREKRRPIVPILKAPPPPPPPGWPKAIFDFPETVIDLGDALDLAVKRVDRADAHIHSVPYESVEEMREANRAARERWAAYSEETAAAVLAELDDLADGLCCHNVLHGRIDDIEAARIEHALNIKDQESFKVAERVAVLVGRPVEGATLSEFTGRIVARDTRDGDLLYWVRWDESATPSSARDNGTNLVDPGRVRWYDPTHGQIDRDIQLHVELMCPKDIGQRTAIENTLQEKRRRGERLVLQTYDSEYDRPTTKD